MKIKYTGKSVSRITNLLVAVKILEKYSNSISFKVNKNIFDGISIKNNVSRNSNYVKKLKQILFLMHYGNQLLKQAQNKSIYI